MSNLIFNNALRELEVTRKGLQYKAIIYLAIIVGIVVGVWSIFHPPMVFLLVAAFFVAAFVYAVTIGIAYGDYVTLYKDRLVKAWFTDAAPKMKYDKSQGANYVEFEFSGFLCDVIKSLDCNECIHGNMHKHPIACSTICIGVEVKKTNPNESQMDHSREFFSYFNGLFIIAGERNENICMDDVLAEVVIAPKGKLRLEELVLNVSSDCGGTLSHYIKEWKEKRVQIAYPEPPNRFYPEKWSYSQSWKVSDIHTTGNEEFDAFFNIYARNKELAVRYVTGEVQEKLISVKKEWSNDVFISFAKKRCYSAFALKKDLLQPPIFRSLTWEEEKKLANEYQKMLFAMESTAEIMQKVYE